MSNFFKTYKRDNLIFNLNPQIKMFIYALLLGVIFIPADHNYLIAFLLLVNLFNLLFWWSELPNSTLKPLITTGILLGIVIFAFNTLNTVSAVPEIDGHDHNHGHDDSHSVWFTWKILPFIVISDANINASIFLVSRILLVIYITTIYVKSTSNYKIVYAFENILMPLKIIKFPVYAFSSMLGFSLRLIPTIFKEGKQILNAQASRGLDYNSSKLTTKVKILVSLVVPLIASSFEKSDEMTLSLESKGFNPYKKRSRGLTFPIKLIDIFFLFVFIGIFIFFLVLYLGVFSGMFQIDWTVINLFQEIFNLN